MSLIVILVVTKLNNYAVSSAQLGEILQKSSSALAIGHTSMEEAVAMGAAMNEILNDASVAGQTLKILSLRLRGAKADLEEAGESTDGMASSVSKLRGQIMALTKNKVDIMVNATEFDSVYNIMDKISEVWDDLADVDRAALLELISGRECQ